MLTCLCLWGLECPPSVLQTRACGAARDVQPRAAQQITRLLCPRVRVRPGHRDAAEPAARARDHVPQGFTTLPRAPPSSRLQLRLVFVDLILVRHSRIPRQGDVGAPAWLQIHTQRIP